MGIGYLTTKIKNIRIKTDKKNVIQIKKERYKMKKKNIDVDYAQWHSLHLLIFFVNFVCYFYYRLAYGYL